ncbi:hypothetical protein HanRHA438_Chr11g0511491 [Helianthus annuus]|uniref:DUF4220 domain-containing protein n=1 Tax=Helianthus annuus TaxID=4232 RepID=A0A9K3N142_HELAN|nr:uncharacterized protein LOC110935688 isoform X1 [Helianthus annuus]XP_035836175.1 uncharacterized protein LOC110935688 isoform X1 [Helianthus annuus]XP_035836176.1 uncharacterized protein LOC110935688 isoform X1 [Helianthus annuus]KAF5782678.1 hypothetical protein HanXRQr2_Chr11g0498821 [Helianthus annuus]KAJ0871365.1 hypothetical protein HanRHA438_Chr11g0511491 [Helianthus annuus]KAJ0875788.1 hypothetical protein HanPSC8_Chr11g0480621 [Helianthus annuus]
MARMLVDIPIPPKWKRLWDTWDLRTFIIISLSLQTFLIFVAPFRKRTKSYWIVMPLWSAYLLADATTNFAVGLISNSMGNPGEDAGKKNRDPVENTDLLAFWAPFLLVHLGGPDTITAFALEDNELWLRHLLGLLFQCVAAIYVFVQSLPDNRLWIPTTLMFATGIIKYAERTRSLYLASADRFKESMLTGPEAGPNYAKLMDEYVSKKKANLPTSIEMVDEPDQAAKSANKAKKGNLTELEVVQYGYMFYKKFRGLIVDTIFSRKERSLGRDFFLNRNAKDAFKVVEVELNFIYEVLFTKLLVVYGKYGAISRFFSLATVCAAIILFVMKSKTNFSDVDVTITYALLFGALGLDLTALFMLLISDWTIITLRESPDDEPVNSFKNKMITKFLKLRTEGTLKATKSNVNSKKDDKKKGVDPSKPSKEDDKPQPSKEDDKPQPSKEDDKQQPSKEDDKAKGVVPPPKLPRWYMLKRRWSETINTFNLINYCLHQRPEPWEKVFEKLGITGLLDGIFYVKPESFSTELRDFIFLELKLKSELADDLETAKEISSARGDWVLRVEEGWGDLLKYVAGVDYDQSLILWHIATELLYNQELRTDNKGDIKGKEISKLLSDYMLYLLIMQSSMMSAVAGIAQIRFRDTCEEAKRFFLDKTIVEPSDQSGNGKPQIPKEAGGKHIQACKEIYEVATEVPPVAIKGDRSKSLLFDGCILAKKLVEKEKDSKSDKWTIISKVWVELLCYAATHCRANMQAAQVSRGGELVTIVWLLMSHFGLGEQFQINEGQSRAILQVGK